MFGSEDADKSLFTLSQCNSLSRSLFISNHWARAIGGDTLFFFKDRVEVLDALYSSAAISTRPFGCETLMSLRMGNGESRK
jgi:hypothetical protein